MTNNDLEYIFMYPPPAILDTLFLREEYNIKELGNVGVYIHIPFCETRCYFCGYYTKLDASDNTVERYFNHVIDFINIIKSEFTAENIAIGGGTPNYKPNKLISFLDKLGKIYDFTDVPISVELHPKQVTVDFLSELKGLGISAVSMGVQTFDRSLLEKINRKTQFSLEEKVKLLSKHFDNNAIELIAGLPFSERRIIEDFRIANNEGINGINFYRYFSHPKSYFTRIREMRRREEEIDNELKELLEESSQTHIIRSVYLLRRKGQENFEEIHYNSKWGGGQILGIGPEVHSYINGEIWFNDKLDWKKIKRYILTPDDIKQRIAVLGIKNLKINFNDFFSITNTDFKSYFQEEISCLVKKGYIEYLDHSIKLTNEGIIKWPEVSFEFYSKKYKLYLENNQLGMGARFLK